MPPSRRSSSALSVSSIFVDRVGPKRTFEDAALAVPATGCSLLSWYGVGGQGKTALARELFRMCSDGSEPNFDHLRAAMLDLHGRVLTDPDRLLVWIRNGFSKAGIAFPVFDLAFAIMWEKTRGDEALPNFENPWLHRGSELVSEAAPDTVEFTRELFESTVETIPLLGFLVKKGIGWSIDKGKRAWLEQTRPHLQEFLRDDRLVEDHEMSALMPWMLAQDLNQHLKKNPQERFVLFVDEYERVTDGAGTGARWSESPFDAAMRTFIAETNGLLVAFFSREGLAWEGDADWKDDLEGNQHLLGGLSDKDAGLWLSKACIEDRAIRSAIIDGAREAEDANAAIYPLMLDLHLAHWHNLGEQAGPKDFEVEATSFEGRRIELVNRLMRDYGDAMQEALFCVALCESFDKTAFEHLLTTRNIPLSFSAFDKVAGLSIVSRMDNGWLSLHRAIADAIILSRDVDEVSTVRNILVSHFSERARPDSSDGVTEETLACFLVASRLRFMVGLDGYVDWLSDAQEKISAAYRPAFLEAIWRAALSSVAHAHGETHPDTATSYNHVAYNLNAQGRYEEAEPVFQRALEIQREVLGETHPGTATSYNNVAAILNARGRYEEAEPLYQKALEIRREALGETHPDTAGSYNEVAANLNAQGRYEEAEPLVQKALEIRREALGETHPDTAGSYNEVAANLNAQGRYEEAEPLVQKALEIRREVLGETHPDTAASYNNVATNLGDLGRYEEAEPLLIAAVKALSPLGPQHPIRVAAERNLENCRAEMRR